MPINDYEREQNWRKDFWSFVSAIRHHWIAFLTGGSVSAFLSFLGGFHFEVSRTLYAMIGVCGGIISATFRAWQARSRILESKDDTIWKEAERFAAEKAALETRFTDLDRKMISDKAAYEEKIRGLEVQLNEQEKKRKARDTLGNCLAMLEERRRELRDLDSMQYDDKQQADAEKKTNSLIVDSICPALESDLG